MTGPARWRAPDGTTVEACSYADRPPRLRVLRPSGHLLAVVAGPADLAALGIELADLQPVEGTDVRNA